MSLISVMAEVRTALQKAGNVQDGPMDEYLQLQGAERRVGSVITFVERGIEYEPQDGVDVLLTVYNVDVETFVEDLTADTVAAGRALFDTVMAVLTSGEVGNLWVEDAERVFDGTTPATRHRIGCKIKRLEQYTSCV